MRICFELLEMLKANKKAIRRATVNTFGYIAKAIGPQDVLATLLNNLKVQERQNRVCTTVAIGIVAETCSPFTVLPALMNEYRVQVKKCDPAVAQLSRLSAPLSHCLRVLTLAPCSLPSPFALRHHCRPAGAQRAERRAEKPFIPVRVHRCAVFCCDCAFWLAKTLTLTVFVFVTTLLSLSRALNAFFLLPTASSFILHTSAGEMGKDYIYAVTPLIEDALMDRDLVHRQVRREEGRGRLVEEAIGC
jgi:hypothetical protein